MKKENRGFTLVELMVVIALVGVLSSGVSIGVPAFQRFLDRERLRTDTRRVLQTIQNARQNAIIEGFEHRVYVNSATNRIYIRKYTPEHPPAKVVEVPGDIRIVNNHFSSGFSLYPIGTVSKGGHITFESRRGHHVTIVVQIGSGRIYMKDGMMYE